ncbi:MAG: hypothetical protein Q9183_000724, partial [Haloplaca sp. 2 TL-2023]
MKTVFSIAALAAVAAAVPAKNNLLALRQAAPEITDDVILNYALTLEHLENNFYQQGLEKFDEAAFADAGFPETRARIQTVSNDESTHVSFLTAALEAVGATPVQECTYNFPLDDVKTFLATAAILEGVGVSAYLGAAADIMSKTYLTAAGSILTVEARHTAYIRDQIDQEPFATPFDVPLKYNEVFTLAAPFIDSCPSDNPPLPVKAFPTLTASPDNPANITSGTEITLLTPDYVVRPADGSSQIYAAFITVTGPVYAEATPVEGGFTLTVPEAEEGNAPIGGQSYVVLTGCNTAVTDETVAAGPAIVEI